MDKLDHSLIALRRIIRSTELFERDLAQAVGLTPVQLRILQVIAEKGWATPTGISARMGVSQGTVTSLVDKLVRKGVVERCPSERDRRQIDIVMTGSGSELLAAAPDSLQQQFVRAFDGLQPWEQSQMLASLERLADMMNAVDIDASPVLSTGEIMGD